LNFNAQIKEIKISVLPHGRRLPELRVDLEISICAKPWNHTELVQTVYINTQIK
jgi:hypothetical protein